MSVLIIDDEDLIRNLATKILQRAGIHALTADSGPAGLSIISENSNLIELVVLDLSMPGMSGADTIAEIRRLVPDMPCILSTGHHIAESDIPSEVSARTNYLQKPYRPQGLLDAVRSLVPEMQMQAK